MCEIKYFKYKSNPYNSINPSHIYIGQNFSQSPGDSTYSVYCDPKDEKIAREQWEEQKKLNLKKASSYYNQKWV